MKIHKKSTHASPPKRHTPTASPDFVCHVAWLLAALPARAPRLRARLASPLCTTEARAKKATHPVH